MYPHHLNEHLYVRHRARHIRQSVYRDARHALSVRRDYRGRVNATSGYAWLDDAATPRILPLLGDERLTFIDDFPEEGYEAYAKIALNTLALDNGRSEEEYEHELGGYMAQEWTFNFAINASSDAIAQALFQDLNDRYVGRIGTPPMPELLDNLQAQESAPESIKGGFITLFNYADDPPMPIVRMEVKTFRYAKMDEEVAPGVQLFFGELVLTDLLPQAGVFPE